MLFALRSEDSDPLTKVRPSYTSPRIVTLSVPSLARSALRLALVAVRQAEDREIGGHKLAGCVDLDCALQRRAAAFDDDVFESCRLRLLGQSEG